MSINIEDLKPKPFTITVKGVELQCKPLRVSHALIVAKVGTVFQDVANTNAQKIKEAERDMDGVIAELLPELKGVDLDLNVTLEIVDQMMNHVEPSETKELEEAGVSFDAGPKAETNKETSKESGQE